jgi:hypothetical protein
MIDAWKQAEQDLGIKVNPEFSVRLINSTKTFLFIENFGGPKGTIVTDLDGTSDFKEIEELGFYCSAVNSARYSTYDRKIFIDTLNDWGFFGEKNKTPDWYTGQSWS